MLRINIALGNPFKHSPWKDYFQKEYKLSQNKSLEIGLYHYAWNIIDFELDLRWKGQSHAGPMLEIGLFGYQFMISIRDHRHWNSHTNNWCIDSDN